MLIFISNNDDWQYAIANIEQLEQVHVILDTKIIQVDSAEVFVLRMIPIDKINVHLPWIRNRWTLISTVFNYLQLKIDNKIINFATTICNFTVIICKETVSNYVFSKLLFTNFLFYLSVRMLFWQYNRILDFKFTDKRSNVGINLSTNKDFKFTWKILTSLIGIWSDIKYATKTRS